MIVTPRAGSATADLHPIHAEKPLSVIPDRHDNAMETKTNVQIRPDQDRAFSQPDEAERTSTLRKLRQRFSLLGRKPRNSGDVITDSEDRPSDEEKSGDAAGPSVGVPTVAATPNDPYAALRAATPVNGWDADDTTVDPAYRDETPVISNTVPPRRGPVALPPIDIPTSPSAPLVHETLPSSAQGRPPRSRRSSMFGAFRINSWGAESFDMHQDPLVSGRDP